MHPIEEACREGFEEERSLSSRHPWPDFKAAALLTASDWRERLPTEEEQAAHDGLWLYQFVQAHGTAVVVEASDVKVGSAGDVPLRCRPITRDGERAVWPEVGP